MAAFWNEEGEEGEDLNSYLQKTCNMDEIPHHPFIGSSSFHHHHLPNPQPAPPQRRSSSSSHGRDPPQAHIARKRKNKAGNDPMLPFQSNAREEKRESKKGKQKKPMTDEGKKEGFLNGSAEEPPSHEGFIHVRARRGQATDSHSLAERVRREKISERMKLLKSLVPGCEKISGKALMLDEIINYVQSLHNQVEFLSTKLANSLMNPSLQDYNIRNFDAYINIPLELQGVEGLPQHLLQDEPTSLHGSTSNYRVMGHEASSSALLPWQQIPSATFPQDHGSSSSIHMQAGQCTIRNSFLP